MSKSGKSKKPITIEEIVKEIRKMEKNKDEQQLLKMAQKSTEQERKRMDRLSQTRKSVEKYLSTPKQKKIVLKTKIERVSPPASGYKYRYFEPEEIFQKAMEEEDGYMMKNAMDRGVNIGLELLPDQEKFHQWISIYKPKSKSELRKHLETLKDELENEIGEEDDENESDEDSEDEEEAEKSQKLAYYLNVLEILKDTTKRK